MHTPAGQPMPKFKPTENFDAHAAKIKGVKKGAKGKSLITFADPFFVEAEIDTKVVNEYAPAEGDYFVVIGGVQSFVSPAEFEAAWKPV